MGRSLEMPRPPRDLQSNYCYHITTRCNNRDFRLTQFACKEILLMAINRCQEKYDFQLFALCIMSNHVHYLLEPQQPDDLPKIMHWLNWYTAMCFNRTLNRTGHFWEKRYYSTGFPKDDYRRVLNTLRYIHANPKAAVMQQGFFYDFSNYGMHERLSDDGLTEWHPAFLNLGDTLDECAQKYQQFCQKYQPKPKPERRNRWGERFLKDLKKKAKTKKAPGQQTLPWDLWEPEGHAEIHEIAAKFIEANCYDPKTNPLLAELDDETQ